MTTIRHFQRNADAIQRCDVASRLASGGLRKRRGCRLRIEGNVAYEVLPVQGKPGSLISQLRGQEYLASVDPGESFLDDFPELGGFIDKMSFAMPECFGVAISGAADNTNVVFFILPASSSIPSQAIKSNPRTPGAPSRTGR